MQFQGCDTRPLPVFSPEDFWEGNGGRRRIATLKVAFSEIVMLKRDIHQRQTGVTLPNLGVQMLSHLLWPPFPHFLFECVLFSVKISPYIILLT